MAIPPSYADLGKSARDIFNKGYGKSLMNWEKSIILFGLEKVVQSFCHHI